jgi:branched-chain amino acid transport system substrate-binding protein
MRTKTLLATAAIAVGLATGTGASAAEYKVGLILPASGAYAALGSEITNGFNLALEHFGADLGGDTITTVSEDTEANVQTGLSKTRKLVLQDKVDVLAGVVSSGVLGAIRDFVDQSKVPLVVANAGNDNATGERCSPYVIRVSFSNSQINRPIGEWLAEQGVKKVYTLAADYAAGHQMIEAFTKSFTAGGGEVIGGTFTPFQKTKDFAPYLTAAKAANPDAIYVFYAGGEAISFVKQYASFGLKGQVPLYSPGWLTSVAYVKAEGPAADGITTGLNYVPTIDLPENKRFQTDYKAKYDRTGSEFAVQGYDAGRLVVEAVKAAGGDKAKLAVALRNVHFTGPRGPLQIDPATNNVVQNLYIYTTKVSGETPTQEIKDVVEGVRDAPNGCSMS